MGPRPDGRGKSSPMTCTSSTRNTRQWGRGQTAAERIWRGIATPSGRKRQWGRGQTAAESRDRNGHDHVARLASMGPRPDGRGKTRLVAARAWPARVNGAAARRPRKVPSVGGCAGRAISVNGAAARRPRKVAYGAAGGVASLASMGPRPDGRGKPHPSRRRMRGPRASMGPRPDGRGKLGGVPRMPAGVVASMGPRPDGRGKPPAPPKPPAGAGRQWGRGQTAAESAGSAGSCSAPKPASMGPRPDGRGKPYSTRRVACSASVNGAAARRPRKVQPRRRPSPLFMASMGPRPDGRGKALRPPPHRSRAAASMGPRPDGRGKRKEREAARVH